MGLERHLDEEEQALLHLILDEQIGVTGYHRARVLVSLREKLLGRPEDEEGLLEDVDLE